MLVVINVWLALVVVAMAVDAVCIPGRPGSNGDKGRCLALVGWLVYIHKASPSRNPALNIGQLAFFNSRHSSFRYIRITILF